MNKSKKVFVALSGGVDSAVTAALLKKQGYNCTGAYMKNWSGDDYGIQTDCPWQKDQEDAKKVCKKLQIPFRSFNFEKEYREKVVEYFFSEYTKGRTPNPDVMCNKEIKFHLFLKKALEEGADMIATGHYVRLQRHPGRNDSVDPGSCGNEIPNTKSQFTNNDQIQNPKTQTNYLTTQLTNIPTSQLHNHPTLLRSFGATEGQASQHHNYSLLKGIDGNKDQSYFLYNITQEQLSKTLFPVGEYTKPEVRKLATKFDLPVAKKPDSQGICFIGDIDVQEFLRTRIKEHEGDIVDVDTKEKVGRHPGIEFFTLGQREGLRIGGAKEPYFVIEKDSARNIIYVGMGEEHPKLFRKRLELESLHLINPEVNILEIGNLEASVRYRHKPASCKILKEKNKWIVIFKEPQRAVTSGQSLVFYNGEICLGGGTID